jgi:hypothetical protein
MRCSTEALRLSTDALDSASPDSSLGSSPVCYYSHLRGHQPSTPENASLLRAMGYHWPRVRGEVSPPAPALMPPQVHHGSLLAPASIVMPPLPLPPSAAVTILRRRTNTT